MKLKIAQTIVTRDPQVNFQKIAGVLQTAQENDWVLFPEGMLSGYYPQETAFLDQLNFEEIASLINKIQTIVLQRKCVCVFGTTYLKDGKWFNSSIVLSTEPQKVYFKNNLATLDRNHFQEGSNLEVYEIDGIKFGIQMCRELVFPEQWRLLKHKGAEVIFHINNSVKVEDKVREHLLVARAFENQLFVASVNNPDLPQTMSSMVVSPKGEIIKELEAQKEITEGVVVDLSEVSDTYKNQERQDLVNIVESK